MDVVLLILPLSAKAQSRSNSASQRVLPTMLKPAVTPNRFLITEFSPVWHHYAYQEQEKFIYEDDYNIPVPLKESLDLEKIIVASLVRAAEARGSARSSG